jgi:hypothetical protein
MLDKFSTFPSTNLAKRNLPGHSSQGFVILRKLFINLMETYENLVLRTVKMKIQQLICSQF